MSERDDYLFDKQGAPDPDVAALERLLAPLAHDGRPLPALPDLTAVAGASHSSPDSTAAADDASPGLAAPSAGVRRLVLPILLAAALVVAAAVALFGPRGGDELAPGASARTIEAAAPRHLAFGEVAVLDLEQGCTLRFEHWRTDSIALELQRGTLRADVPAPGAKGEPELRIGTAYGDVTIDAGADSCAFRMSIALDSGVGDVGVKRGAVRLAAEGRSVLVPAGASVALGPGGPRHPMFDDSSDELRKAVAMLEAYAAKGEPQFATKSAFSVLSASRTKHDTLVLWHLLDEPGAPRAEIEKQLVELAGEPSSSAKMKVPTWSKDEWREHLRATAW